MAHFANPDQTGSGIWSSVSNFFAVILNTARIQRDLDNRMREMRKLEAMSDGELAKRGIARDRITHHVFRDIYYV